MTRRQSLLAYAALLIGVTTFASSFARPSSGQPDPGALALEGRYRVAALASASGSYVLVTDSVTGQTWSHPVGVVISKWTALGTPVPAR